MTSTDMHVVPPGDSINHIEAPDCPCNPTGHPARNGTLYNHRAQDDREPFRPPAPTGIQFKPNPPDPMIECLVEWMRVAELRYNGEVTHTGLNLVGNVHNARKYARLIAEHIHANGPDLNSLTDHLRHPRGAGAHFKVWAFAPHVAEGALEALRRQGLI